MASQAPTAPEHMQNENSNQNLKGNDYQNQEPIPKLQNGGQPNPQQAADQHGKSIKSPPSNGNSGIGPPNENMMPGYHPDPNMPPNMPPSSQAGHLHQMHHPGAVGEGKDELSQHQQPPHLLQQQHPMYGHPPMHGHSMHGPPPPHQQIPGHHMPMHHHPQQRYHPGGPPPPHGHPHSQMQHPMHLHDPSQQQQMPDPYGHYRGMMPSRPPPQRYGMPGQGPVPPSVPPNTQNVPSGAQQAPPGAGQQQGPTPTLNSLLQSQPSPQQVTPQQAGPHRYPYDPYGQPVSGNGPPPIPQPNSGSSSPMPTHPQSQQQQNWAPPPRPYSPQQYRGPPPPANPSRGQSPYPSSGQSPGPYSGPNAGQVPNQPPSSQPTGPMPPQQYQYPQRYPTPPGSQVPQQSMGPQNHRPPYGQWPSPAASPGPHSHSNLGPPPAQSPHSAAPSQSPGPQQQQQGHQQSNAPCSPSPQAPPSPHQQNPNRPTQPTTNSTNDNELIGVNQKKKPTNTKKKTKKQQKQEAAAAAAAQNSTNESNSSNLAANNSNQPPPPSNQQQQHQQAPSNNVGPGAQPNNPQQSMRPISSPNSSSSGSRSMSPAVGQQILQMPPRPSSSHSQQQGMPPGQNIQSSNSTNAPLDNPMQSPPMPMQQQGSYGAQPAPHLQQHGGYKMGPYPPPQSQYSQANYSPRAQYTGYGNQGPPQGPPNSPVQHRPMYNHVGPPQGHPGYPPYQNWAPPPQNNPNVMTNHIQGKNIMPPGPPQSPGVQQGMPSAQQQQQQQQQAGGSPRQLNYLKQHLQHKGGYSQGSTPPPQGYGNGPGIHPTMGPPSHMGPPSTAMGPPPTSTGTPPSHMENPAMQIPPGIHHQDVMPVPQDNGIQQSPHPVTSLITTGPDGTQLDEASQQSTLSNTSIGDDQGTPKSRKNEMMYNHPMTPNQVNANASPVPGHPHGAEDFEMGSPPWPRTPASPVFNSSHVPPPQDSYRSSTKVKKSDSLAKLYEMDDNPERRVYLDKLLGYMDEIRKPVTACPTISKQPLDLYRLYLYVKERGGFMEVCKVTKSKTWKDIAGLLGIGASSSAAYTLRKHYIKSILPFECQFDRGGIDPGPIIQSIEAGAKKKTTKPTSVPSPGSSNSQDSFPPPGSGGASLDGYNAYPGQYPAPTPAGQEYGPAMQRPPSQTNAQTPHPPGNPPPTTNDNISVSNPFDDPVAPRPYQQSGAQFPPVSRPQAPYQGQYNHQPPPFGPEQTPYGPAGQYPQQNQYPSNRQMYPPYPEGEPNFRTSGPPPNEAYRSYPGHYPPPPGSQQQVGPMQARPPYGPQGSQQPISSGTPPVTPHSSQVPTQSPIVPPVSSSSSSSNIPVPASVNSSSAPATIPQPSQQMPTPGGMIPPSSGAPNVAPNQNYPAVPPPNQDYYNRPDQNAQPRRHPDFTKDANQQQPYPYGGQRPQMYGGWPPNTSSTGQYRPQYPSQPGPQQWPGQGPRPGPPAGANQWDQRYPLNQQGYGPNQQWPGQGSPMRPPQRGGKPFAMPPPQGPQPINKMPNQYGPHGPSHMQPMPHPNQQQYMGHPQQHQQQQGGPSGMLQAKRDIVFPQDTVEATQPLLYRRKRMTKHDVGPVDPWRIFMALRSGLLSESTWALDVLNVLLFDDSSVVYFGLAHLPGLLNLLLEHFQKSLSDMFGTQSSCKKAIAGAIKASTDGDSVDDDENETCNKNNGGDNKLSSNLIRINSDTGDTSCKQIKDDDDESSLVDLGSVTFVPNPNEHLVVLKSTFNYTMQSRKGVQVKMQDASNDIFVMDHQKKWDKMSDRDHYLKATVGDDPFNVGQEPNTVEYIMDCFKAEFAHIPFARYIKSTKTNDGRTTPRTTTSEMRPTAAKRMRLSSEEEREIEELTRKLYQRPPAKQQNAVLKKESNSDADCRQVDMELEKVPNGPMPENGDIKTEEEEKVTEQEPEGFNPKQSVNDPAKSLKRRRMSDYEDECYTRDEASLHLITDNEDSLARRCISLSTILRNLTFVPGNELEFARSTTFLSILGKLLLIHHDHPIRTKKQRNYDREEDADFTDSCSSLQNEHEWWWDFLVQIRENMLVSVANISGHLDLSQYDEPISRPVLDGLLHWAICPSAHGQDPFTTLSNHHSVLSPQRLALEALCKLCVTDANVDLVIATPPFSRLEKLCAVLTRHLCKNEDQVLREFSVNLLHYLASADSAMARTVAKQSPCVSYLVAFIEQAEQTALGVANQHGINFLRDNPDSMGTSLDMLRRAAGTLLHLAKHPDNRPLFMQQEQRLLGLVMSHILDQQVALIISKVLYQTSRGIGPLTTTQQMEQFSEGIPSKIIHDGQKELSTLASVPMLTEPSLKPSVHQNAINVVPNSQNITQMKSPAMMQLPPIQAKLLNSTSSSTDDLVKPKLNTINKQLPTSSPSTSSAPTIPQTVTASS